MPPLSTLPTYDGSYAMSCDSFLRLDRATSRQEPTGRPIDPRADHDDWKALLTAASVRDARLHDARHTAATVLLLLGVPDRTVMGLMGWSQSAMTVRYQHLTAAIRRDVAGQVAALLWIGRQ